MKRLLVGLACLLSVAVLLTSCETYLKSAPPVTVAFVQASQADEQTLLEGRKVFLNRCILCHALPEVDRYSSARIPGIVGWMSGRARLTPEQKNALTRYLLTVKSQL
jgi:hypothetical protein